MLFGQDAAPSEPANAPKTSSEQANAPKTAGEQTNTPTFSSNVKVVTVLATVRDKHGNIINTLNKDDFKLEQDGQVQTIRYFNKDTDLPLTLGLLVDTSMSQRRVLDQERIASNGFLNDLMRVDKDKAFIIHFDWEIELLQDLTSSRQKLEAALDKLDMPKFDSSGGGGGGTAAVLVEVAGIIAAAEVPRCMTRYFWRRTRSCRSSRAARP